MEKGIFGGKYKAITFSFDDGNSDDVRLIEIMNKYGLKGTFNLNSGSLTKTSCWRFENVKDVRHINYFDYPDLYSGHEIAGHTYTHPDLTKIDDKTVENQIKLDKVILKALYNTDIEGFAYPFGTYNDTVMEILKSNGIKYARTTKNTDNFDLPENPLVWHPTCKYTAANIEEVAQRFFDSEEKNILLYIWGHSYELVTEDDWAHFESVCKLLGGHSDVCYCTNIEVIKSLG